MEKSVEQIKRVNTFSQIQILNFILFLNNEGIKDTKVTMDAKLTDGTHYRLIFERLGTDQETITEHVIIK